MSPRPRRRFDDDDIFPDPSTTLRRTAAPEPDPVDPAWSSFVDALQGPHPAPSWVVTSPAAVDTELGVLKSGKEADVALVRRCHGADAVLLAAKRYRDAQHRLFHRDAGYLEGRHVRRSRENRAMARRTGFGRDLIAGQWALAEFRVLATLWQAGAAVPYPVQLSGTELMMEFIGADDGTAAPRLAEVRPGRRQAAALFAQLRDVLLCLADVGYTHGDLSAYNVLVHHDRVVLIDLPQAVDVVANPQGQAFLRRDCENICTWFEGRGAVADAVRLEHDLLRATSGA